MTADTEDKQLHALKDLPLPPNLAELLGYMGDARFVGVTERGQDMLVTDGRVDMGGERAVWQAYVEHGRVRAALEPHGFAESVPPAGLALMLDRRLGTAHVGRLALVSRFLKDQWVKRAKAGDDGYSTGEFERTLDGLRKAVDLMEDTSMEQLLDRSQLRRRRLDAMQRWLTELA